jgi:predicted AlkP superfamily pyrophosphatase or phosphodiesterase
MIDESMLIVAFDGLDHELLQQYGCRTFVDMDRFGRIDNQTGIHHIKTCELFASFITGELPDTHGVTELKTWNTEQMQKVRRFCQKYLVANKWAALRRAAISSINRLDANWRAYHREDLQCPTLFDTIPGSRALNVPSYSKNTMLNRATTAIDLDLGLGHMERDVRAEFMYRQRELWKLMACEPPLLMAHFHFPDFMQHMHGDDQEQLRPVYEEIDDLAAAIMDAADGFDEILFMSDHGMPTENEHNENAFYGTTLDVDGKPHMTDFYDIIVEVMGQSGLSLDV